MSIVYTLNGGPLDGEDLLVEEEALRVSIPYSCDQGCCAWGETYDWDENSDKEGQLWYVGRLDIDAVLEDENCAYQESMGEFQTCPDGRDEAIADLEAMYLGDDENYYD